jgi:hypothetical protein
MAKPAIVLEHFRDQGVPISEVAQRLKEGGGFARIYRRISGRTSVMDEASDDLDVLRCDQKIPDNHDVRPLSPTETTGRSVERLEHNEPRTTMSDIDAERETVEPDGPRQGHNKRPANVVSPMTSTSHGHTFSAQVDADGLRETTLPARRTPKNTIFVTADQLQIKRTFSRKRVAILPPLVHRLRGAYSKSSPPKSRPLTITRGPGPSSSIPGNLLGTTIGTMRRRSPMEPNGREPRRRSLRRPPSPCRRYRLRHPCRPRNLLLNHDGACCLLSQRPI